MHSAFQDNGDYPDSFLLPEDDLPWIPKVGDRHEDRVGVSHGHGRYVHEGFHILVKRGKVWAVWEAR